MKEKDFSLVIKKCRKELLDSLELAYGLNPNWKTVRSKVLSILGDLERISDQPSSTDSYFSPLINSPPNPTNKSIQELN